MKMKTPHPQIMFLLTCMLAMSCFIVPVAGGTMNNTSNHNNNKYSCITREREALLEFKHGVIDNDGFLNSWGGNDDQQDCCQWDCVSCSNLTGDVIGFDLSNTFLEGSISSALANMSALSHLDLSGNQFQGPFPVFLAKMGALSHPDLSNNQFQGLIPIALGNMTSLSHLDLSNNKFEGPIPANVFANMSALSYLGLSSNLFEGPIPASVFWSMRALSFLDLSQNRFEGSGWLSNIIGSLCSLETLILSNNNIGDELSAIISALFGQCANTSLVFFDLSYNQVWGSIHDTIGTFCLLEELHISGNQLNGTISYNLGQLATLKTLDVAYNSLQGTLSNNHLSNLSKLSVFDVSHNPSLVVDISSDWIPLFQLSSISMSSCKLGPRFPKWVLTQKKYQNLDISETGISDTIPPSFWNSLSPDVITDGRTTFNLSHNKIYGVLPAKTNSNIIDSFGEVDLSSNLFEGTIPSFGENTFVLFLNNNKFIDSTSLLCPTIDMAMVILDLSNNFLLGALPNCWTKFLGLQILRLENNNFSGNLPISIGVLMNLKFLHLRNNNFSGELFTPLENCTSLIILDAECNSLTGPIPLEIGSIWWNIGILNLRNNNFHGMLPLSLCELFSLQILDLSNNNISGTIPECISDLRAMKNATDPSLYAIEVIGYNFPQLGYYDSATVMWKGREFRFKNTLGLVISIDVSHNKLEGRIPSGISSLQGFISLDMSGNMLTGNIPPEIGQLTSIELLDLSNNHLSGQIPTSLANMNSLGILDLSDNNLSGEIPSGTQLEGFDASSYIVNPKLCGPPLPRCQGVDLPSTKAHRGDQDENNIPKNDDYFPGLYISVVFGFIVGFWGVCRTLEIRTSWRIAYFRFVDDLKDKIW